MWPEKQSSVARRQGGELVSQMRWGRLCVVWGGQEGYQQLYKDQPFNHLKYLQGYNSHFLDEETGIETEELGSFQSAKGDIWREATDSRFVFLTIC